MDKITLKSDRLTIELLQHGDPTYARTRFDWTGFITGIRLDGKHTFASGESPNPNHRSSGGMGLCNEFKCDAAYTDAKAGERFAKFGVGTLLKTSDKPYTFMEDYPVEPYACTTNTTPDSASFALAAQPAVGYAATLNKVVSVKDNALTIGYAMKNAGDKAISFREYNHNFVAINARPIGAAYKLHVSYISQRALDAATPSLTGIPGGLGVLPGDRPNMMYTMDNGIIDADTYQWELTHDEEPVGMREISPFKPVGFAVWGVGHVISPEVFFGARLEPGQSVEWSRKWEFFRVADEMIAGV